MINILLYILYIFSFLTGSLIAQENKPLANRGVMELSNYSFESQIIKLDGEWDFYWNQLNPDLDTKEHILIGETWKSKIINGSTLSGTGYATYKVKLIFSESQVGKIFVVKFFQIFFLRNQIPHSI